MKIVHALEGAAVALLAEVPALVASPAVQDFVHKHPADAALVPVAVGLASMLYRWLKEKATGKVTVAPVVTPIVTPTVSAPNATPTVTTPPPETKP